MERYKFLAKDTMLTLNCAPVRKSGQSALHGGPATGIRPRMRLDPPKQVAAPLSKALHVASEHDGQFGQLPIAHSPV